MKYCIRAVSELGENGFLFLESKIIKVPIPGHSNNHLDTQTVFVFEKFIPDSINNDIDPEDIKESEENRSRRMKRYIDERLDEIEKQKKNNIP